MEASILKSGILESRHGFSTRIGGVSSGIYESLNLGMNRGDDKKLVIKNWDIFLEACGVKEREFVCGAQVHGNNVHIATKSDLRPAYGPGELIEADGYVTREEGVALAIFTADCVPILLEDRRNGVVGTVHAGWRGAVADIEGEAIKKMLLLGAEEKHIKAAIGPSIDKCCFEVGEEVAEGIMSLLDSDGNAFLMKKENGKYMADLRGAVGKRFEQVGVVSHNIEFVGGCTMCNPKQFWSHRFTNGIRGSQASLIIL